MLPSNIIFKKVPKHIKEIMVKIIIPSFAAGTLLATSVFLLIPESLHLLNGGHDDHERRRLENSEVDATWKFGASLIGGYFLPYIFGGIIPHAKHADTTTCPPTIEAAEKENAAELRGDIESEAKASTDTSHSNEKLEDEIMPQDLQLAISLSIGDAFHNFADGIMIGTAFLLCSQSIAVTVTATTVLHELSQELSDFILLTTQCGLTIPKALLINFLSGSSVILGVIVILSTYVSNEAIGVILAMSSGVYLFVTLTECAPRITASLSDNRRRFLSIIFWIIGTIPIGLILLNHKHCE
jgi:zinc transporter ZupT